MNLETRILYVCVYIMELQAMQCYIFYHGMDFVTKLLDPKSYIWSQCYFPTTNEKFLGTRVHPTRVHLITLILTAQAVLTTLRIRELDSKQKQ